MEVGFSERLSVRLREAEMERLWMRVEAEEMAQTGRE